MTDNEFDPFIADIASELREPVRFDARFDERVMAALEPEVISLDSRRPSLPWYRRTFAVSGGLAAAAGFAAIAAIGTLSMRQRGAAPVVATSQSELTPVANIDRSAELQPTLFLLADPTLKSVALIGDFNDWDSAANPMVFDSTHGAWSVTVPLAPGLHQYQFLINGERHMTDPAAPMMTGDFGSPNSVVTVRVPR